MWEFRDFGIDTIEACRSAYSRLYQGDDEARSKERPITGKLKETRAHD